MAIRKFKITYRIYTHRLGLQFGTLTKVSVKLPKSVLFLFSLRSPTLAMTNHRSFSVGFETGSYVVQAALELPIG